MHINFTLSSLRISLRDHPLPLAEICALPDATVAVWEFDTDLVVAEELGTDLSVDWVDCPIVGTEDGSAPLSISVPKTIMPVKTYANPEINVTTPAPTIFSWGVSYGAATQDMMRVLDTLSSAPRDPSPGVGFWDKFRLILHWSVRATFKGEVRYQMKGLRDPYETRGSGAGFVLAWQGHPKLLIARKNDQGELVQVVSDSMLIAVPNLKRPSSLDSCEPSRASEPPPPFRKICAKFRSGVRFGVGFVLERTCGPECTHCSGSAFHRHCRFYTFKPHFQVMLEKKSSIPVKHGQNDSYSEFRSDFIHLSISLTSATRTSSPHSYRHPSSLHLTPKAFTHFYSWWGLFENVLSLPIRQGNYYPRRALSPKFTRHLATIKYRIVVPQLFVMHGYTDESRETWADSVTPWVGVKGMIDELQVDMHQRDQETTVPGLLPGSTKILRRKPFYAAELVMKGLDLRAILATFTEPLKQHVTMSAPPERSNYRARKDLPTTDPSSKWYNPDDFVETDWSPSSTPSLHVLPIATSARFMYFKRNSSVLEDTSQSSKFGNEDSHQCLLGKEPSAPDVQISIVRARISELKAMIDMHDGPDGQPQQNGELSSEKKISLLEKYISVLQDMQTRLGQDADVKNPTYYQMPSDTVSADEWAEFDNVYHIHCPRISMDSAIRDIMMQYYYCSRARRGVEYHMATRAVKFIRDQAEATLSTSAQSPSDKSSGHTNTAQAAATALRKLLIGDHSESSNISEELGSAVAPNNLKPLDGWSSGVSLKKSHCFLLLKPQVVLRHKAPGVEEQTCIVAAHQAKMQSFDIMDDSNIEDPISGKVMSRGYTVVSGLQTFAPTKVASSEGGCVPLEVLIDFRCESNEFDRLVPQTDATFHYDKFNRLRLRNNVISVATREPTNKSDVFFENHLQDQTDLMQVTCPRFTVTASDKHFQTISNIVTKLLLFSDAAHKTRLEKIETLLFTYDFTDLTSAAKVISDLQNRLRDAAETERQAEGNIYNINASGKLELCKLRAHIFVLTEELGLLFDAIKLAQDRDDDRVDSKSAVLLRASSSEISWRMLDDQRDLLTKLVAQDIDYAWLSRQDSSTINNLSLGNLQAFDGSRNAVWTEIISKYDEPANHPLLKKGLFLLANWAVLPPVGGITIYESFELMFHPLRLQIDARVGRRIMEYVWPARRERKALEGESVEEAASSLKAATSMRSSLDIPRTPRAQDAETMLAPPKLRRLHVSRSFTDLRSTAAAPSSLQAPKIRSLQSTRSSEALRQNTAPGAVEHRRPKSRAGTRSGSTGPAPKAGDAAEMRTRSSQKTFVYVRIASLNMLLSIMKEDSFLCRDARISTRDLEYRNQTSSFEELVDQFIPADMSWKGWVKMAFHQPLVPVIPVARELISKTKWMASKTHLEPNASPPKRHRIKAAPPDNVENDTHLQSGKNTRARTPSPHRTLKKLLRPRPQTPPPPLPHFTPGPITSEPEPLEEEGQGRPGRPNARSRVLSIFHRGPKKSNSSTSSTSFSSSSLRVSEEPDDQSPHPSQ